MERQSHFYRSKANGGPTAHICMGSYLSWQYNYFYAVFPASLGVLGHALNMLRDRACRNCEEPGWSATAIGTQCQ